MSITAIVKFSLLRTQNSIIFLLVCHSFSISEFTKQVSVHPIHSNWHDSSDKPCLFTSSNLNRKEYLAQTMLMIYLYWCCFRNLSKNHNTTLMTWSHFLTLLINLHHGRSWNLKKNFIQKWYYNSIKKLFISISN